MAVETDQTRQEMQRVRIAAVENLQGIAGKYWKKRGVETTEVKGLGRPATKEEMQQITGR